MFRPYKSCLSTVYQEGYSGLYTGRLNCRVLPLAGKEMRERQLSMVKKYARLYWRRIRERIF